MKKTNQHFVRRSEFCGFLWRANAHIFGVRPIWSLCLSKVWRIQATIRPIVNINWRKVVTILTMIHNRTLNSNERWIIPIFRCNSCRSCYSPFISIDCLYRFVRKFLFHYGHNIWSQYASLFVLHLLSILVLLCYQIKKKPGGGEVSWCKRGHRQHWKHTKLKPNRLPVSLSWAIIAQWISFRLLKRKTQHQLDQWLWWVRARSWLCIYLFRCVIVVCVCFCFIFNASIVSVSSWVRQRYWICSSDYYL